MSTHAKEDFWIGAKGGLVEWKHYRRMGKAVWLFLHLLRCQTALSPRGEGVVYYGHPMTLESIRHETRGFPIRTLKRWISRLRERGYIRTEDHGHKGIVFWICNAKHKTKKATVQRLTAKVVHKTELAPGTKVAPIGFAPGTKVAPNEAAPGPKTVPIEIPERPQSNEPAKVAAESVSPITKGFIPTSLSYYNKEAAAETAAFPTPLLERSQRQRQQPTPLKDLEARYLEKHPELRARL